MKLTPDQVEQFVNGFWEHLLRDFPNLAEAYRSIHKGHVAFDAAMKQARDAGDEDTPRMVSVCLALAIARRTPPPPRPRKYRGVK